MIFMKRDVRLNVYIYRIYQKWFTRCASLTSYEEDKQREREREGYRSGIYIGTFSMSILVGMISRLFKIVGLLCKRALSKRLHSAEETQNLKEPDNRSHPIFDAVCVQGGEDA